MIMIQRKDDKQSISVQEACNPSKRKRVRLRIYNVLMITLFTIACIFLELFCLINVKDGWVARFNVLLSIGAIVLTLGVYACSLICYVKGVEKLYKGTIVAYIFVVFFLAVLL